MECGEFPILVIIMLFSLGPFLLRGFPFWWSSADTPAHLYRVSTYLVMFTEFSCVIALILVTLKLLICYMNRLSIKLSETASRCSIFPLKTFGFFLWGCCLDYNILYIYLIIFWNISWKFLGWLFTSASKSPIFFHQSLLEGRDYYYLVTLSDLRSAITEPLCIRS